MLIFISGAVRSGKSTLGEQYAGSLSKGRKIYLATSKAYDDEMVTRIKNHCQGREKKDFLTIEKPENISEIVHNLYNNDTILLDCLGTLVSNEMFYDFSLQYNEQMKTDIINKIYNDISTINNKVSNLIIISNDIFSDGIIYDSATEHYIDVLGSLHIKIASIADIAVECTYKTNNFFKGV